MFGFIKRLFGGPKQEEKADQSTAPIYTGPERMTDHSMAPVYASPDRMTDYSMGTVYDSPYRMGHDGWKTRGSYDGWPEGAVYPNNHRAPESRPPREKDGYTADGFPFADLSPDATSQMLDGPEGMLFLYKKAGTPIRLSAPAAAIGRGSECAVVLDDAAVSSLHAILTFNRDSWYIRDCGSTNGTRLNGVPLGPGKNYLIRPGDRILLAGREELVAVLSHSR